MRKILVLEVPLNRGTLEVLRKAGLDERTLKKVAARAKEVEELGWSVVRERTEGGDVWIIGAAPAVASVLRKNPRLQERFVLFWEGWNEGLKEYLPRLFRRYFSREEAEKVLAEVRREASLAPAYKAGARLIRCFPLRSEEETERYYEILDRLRKSF